MMTDSAMPVEQKGWRRWVVKPILKQLTMGITAEKISWSIALGSVLGIFPILGSTTIVCLIVGQMLKLNQPVMQVFKWIVYPLHLALILVFIRLGERLYGVPLISFSLPQLIQKFEQDPGKFVREFGMAAVHGVSAWLIIAPVLAVSIKVSVLPLVRKLAQSIKARKEVAA